MPSGILATRNTVITMSLTDPSNDLIHNSVNISVFTWGATWPAQEPKRTTKYDWKVRAVGRKRDPKAKTRKRILPTIELRGSMPPTNWFKLERLLEHSCEVGHGLNFVWALQRHDTERVVATEFSATLPDGKAYTAAENVQAVSYTLKLAVVRSD